MSLTSHLNKRLIVLLDEHRVVVWYDREDAFKDFAVAFRAPGCQVVLATDSTLRARREAESVYAKMNESDNHAESRANLLLYVPRARGATPEAKQRDPFEVFALAGCAFGDNEAEFLQSLARQAMPEHASAIDRLFAEAKPTLALLDGLESGESWPLIREALETESPVDIVAQVLCNRDKSAQVAKVAGCRAEILRLLKSAFGFERPTQATTWKEIQLHLGTYVLFSEFAFDLPGPLPDALSAVPRSGAPHREGIFATLRTHANKRPTPGPVHRARRTGRIRPAPGFRDGRHRAARDPRHLRVRGAPVPRAAPCDGSRQKTLLRRARS